MNNLASSAPSPPLPLPHHQKRQLRQSASLLQVLRKANPVLLLLGKGWIGSTWASRLQLILLVSISAALLRLCVLRVLLPRIASLLVASSKLVFTSARIEEPAERELVMAVKGALSETGPLNVSISAPNGLSVLFRLTRTTFKHNVFASSSASDPGCETPSSRSSYQLQMTSSSSSSATPYRPPSVDVGDESSELELSRATEATEETSDKFVENPGVETATSLVPLHPVSKGVLKRLRRFWARHFGSAQPDTSETAGLSKAGTVMMPEIRVRKAEHVTRLDMSTRVYVVDSEVFGELAQKMVADRTFTMILHGRVDLHLFGGYFTVPSVLMHKEITMRGMAGLRSVVVQSLTVERGTADHIELSSEVEIHNPSDVSVDMGDTRLTLRFEQQIVGSVLLPDLFLRQGRNVVRSRVFFGANPRNLSAMAAARTLLSRFATGRSSTVNIRGDHPKTTKLPYIRPALRALNVTCEMEGVAEPLLRSALLVLSPKHLLIALAGTAQSRVELANPFGEYMTVLAMDASVFVDGQVIGVIHTDLSKNPIFVPPMSAQQSDNLPVALRINSKAVRALLDAAGGQLFVDVKSSLLVKVGEYTTKLDYDRDNVPCALLI